MTQGSFAVIIYIIHTNKRKIITRSQSCRGTKLNCFCPSADYYIYLIGCDIVALSYLLVEFFHVGELWNDAGWTAVRLLTVKNQFRFWYRRIGWFSDVSGTRPVTSGVLVFVFRIFRLISRQHPFKHDRLQCTDLQRSTNKSNEQRLSCRSNKQNDTLLRWGN